MTCLKLPINTQTVNEAAHCSKVFGKFHVIWAIANFPTWSVGQVTFGKMTINFVAIKT